MLPTRELTPTRAQFLADVLCTAVDGGIQHWAQVEHYRCYHPDSPGASDEDCDRIEGVANAYATVREVGDDPQDPENTVRTIGLDEIEAALELIRSQAFIRGLDRHVRDIIRENDRCNGEPDAGEDIDAGTAGDVVQIAVLGEVVY